MKKKQLFAGLITLISAGILALFNLETIETVSSGPLQVNVHLYPVWFFLLLGILLIFLGLKPLWQER